jgi:hypothetical protein
MNHKTTNTTIGRPPHLPTAASRTQVLYLAAMHLPQSHIATTLNISLKTLRKHYKDQLALGPVTSNVAVTKTLFEKAVSGKDLQATIFWVKTRCGFCTRRPAAKGEPAT